MRPARDPGAQLTQRRFFARAARPRGVNSIRIVVWSSRLPRVINPARHNRHMAGEPRPFIMKVKRLESWQTSSRAVVSSTRRCGSVRCRSTISSCRGLGRLEGYAFDQFEASYNAYRRRLNSLFHGL
jgi:hypothetical protein